MDAVQWLDGSSAQVSVLDRGLAYGDGLFETIRVNASGPVLLAAHLERLRLGLQRLHIEYPADLFDELNQRIQRLIEIHAAANAPWVLKILLTRGAGGRGYRVPQHPQLTAALIAHPLPDYPSSHYEQGIRVRLCQHRLPHHPLLAGIKHLNRLDSVLARAEWQDDYEEGLLLDYAGYIIEGTASNVFLLLNDDGWVTPDLQYAGVDGVMRDQFMTHLKQEGWPMRVAQVTQPDLQRLRALVMVNSVFGCWWVKQLDDQALPADEEARALVRRVNQHWGFN